jgi:myo-inositol 2-dehydrogenase/D-chiro-inositol 1-dehydrogenase
MRIGLVGAGRIGTVHATNLGSLPGVTEALLTDLDQARAAELARATGLTAAPDVDALLAAGLDGLVVAAPTSEHAALLDRAAAAGVAVFCEKPLATDVPGTLAATDRLAQAGVPLQMGFQRRFDPGYRAARAAVEAGELGWLHTVWACTYDPAPPPADYIRGSGGIFRDCSVHDFDVIRWVTGREVVEVYADGANRGEAFFEEAGDVDTATALLTLDDGTIAFVGATRYNGAGYDVRMEVHGSSGTVAVGLDEATPLRSVEAGVRWPAGTGYPHFTQRFADAYAAELAAFCEVAAGRADSPCGGEDALAALLIAEACERSRAQRRPVRLADVRAELTAADSAPGVAR